MTLSKRRFPFTGLFPALLLAASIALWAAGSSDFRRLATDPVLSPAGSGWESAGAFNPAAIRRGGKTILLYRAQDARGTSRIGYAESTDAIHFVKPGAPVLVPAADHEKDGGVEDPRLVEIDGWHYLTYTGYNKRTRSSVWRSPAICFTGNARAFFCLPTKATGIPAGQSPAQF